MVSARPPPTSNPLLELHRLFGLLSSKSIRPSVRPSEVRNTLPEFFRQGYVQHDAGEFTKIFLDLLEKAGGKEVSGSADSVSAGVAKLRRQAGQPHHLRRMLIRDGEGRGVRGPGTASL